MQVKEKKFQMSILTLRKCSENRNIHNGYRWKINE